MQMNRYVREYPRHAEAKRIVIIAIYKFLFL